MPSPLNETPSALLTHRSMEGRLCVIAMHREDDALQTAAGIEMSPDLVDLDSRGVVEREAAHTRAEGDEGEALRAEFVRLGEGARRRLADDLSRGRAAELHG